MVFWLLMIAVWLHVCKDLLAAEFGAIHAWEVHLLKYYTHLLHVTVLCGGTMSACIFLNPKLMLAETIIAPWNTEINQHCVVQQPYLQHSPLGPTVRRDIRVRTNNGVVPFGIMRRRRSPCSPTCRPMPHSATYLNVPAHTASGRM